MSLTVKNDDVTSGIRTGGYGRFRGKMVKLDLVKITLEGNPKMLDHSDKLKLINSTFLYEVFVTGKSVDVINVVTISIKS